MFRIVLTKKLVPGKDLIVTNEKWIVMLVSNDYKRDEKIIGHIADKCFCEHWFKSGCYKEKIQFVLNFNSEEKLKKCVKLLGKCHLYDKNI